MNWNTTELKIDNDFTSEPLTITGIKKTKVQDWDCYSIEVKEDIVYRENIFDSKTATRKEFYTYQGTFKDRHNNDSQNNAFYYFIHELGKGNKTRIPFKGAWYNTDFTKLVFCLSEEVNNIIEEEKQKWIAAGYNREEDLKTENKAIVEAKHEVLNQIPGLSEQEKELIKKATTIEKVRELQATLQRENQQLQGKKDNAIQAVENYWNSKKAADDKIDGKSIEEILGNDWKGKFGNLKTEGEIHQERDRLIGNINVSFLEQKNKELTGERDSALIAQANAEQERDEARRERDALPTTAQLTDLQGQFNTLKGERDNLKQERDTLTNERDTLSTERDQLGQELAARPTVAQLDEVQNNLTTANTANQTYENGLKTTLGLNATDALPTTWTDQIAKKVDLTAAEGARDVAIAERDAARTTVANAQTHLGVANLANLPDMAGDSLVQALAKADRATTAETERDTAINAQAAAERERDARANITPENLKALTDKKDNLEKDLTSSRSANTVLKKEVNILRARIAKLESGKPNNINIEEIIEQGKNAKTIEKLVESIGSLDLYLNSEQFRGIDEQKKEEIRQLRILLGARLKANQDIERELLNDREIYELNQEDIIDKYQRHAEKIGDLIEKQAIEDFAKMMVEYLPKQKKAHRELSDALKEAEKVSRDDYQSEKDLFEERRHARQDLDDLSEDISLEAKHAYQIMNEDNKVPKFIDKLAKQIEKHLEAEGGYEEKINNPADKERLLKWFEVVAGKFGKSRLNGKIINIDDKCKPSSNGTTRWIDSRGSGFKMSYNFTNEERLQKGGISICSTFSHELAHATTKLREVGDPGTKHRPIGEIKPEDALTWHQSHSWAFWQDFRVLRNSTLNYVGSCMSPEKRRALMTYTLSPIVTFDASGNSQNAQSQNRFIYFPGAESELDEIGQEKVKDYANEDVSLISKEWEHTWQQVFRTINDSMDEDKNNWKETSERWGAKEHWATVWIKTPWEIKAKEKKINNYGVDDFRFGSSRIDHNWGVAGPDLNNYIAVGSGLTTRQANIVYLLGYDHGDINAGTMEITIAPGVIGAGVYNVTNDAQLLALVQARAKTQNLFQDTTSWVIPLSTHEQATLKQSHLNSPEAIICANLLMNILRGHKGNALDADGGNPQNGDWRDDAACTAGINHFNFTLAEQAVINGFQDSPNNSAWSRALVTINARYGNAIKKIYEKGLRYKIYIFYKETMPMEVQQKLNSMFSEGWRSKAISHKKWGRIAGLVNSAEDGFENSNHDQEAKIVVSQPPFFNSK